MHVRLNPDDQALHTRSNLSRNFQTFFKRWCAFFELVIAAAHHADLHNAVALLQQFEIFRLCDDPSLCRNNKGVFGFSKDAQSVVAHAVIALTRLERVAHAPQCNGIFQSHQLVSDVRFP